MCCAHSFESADKEFKELKEFKEFKEFKAGAEGFGAQAGKNASG